MCPVAVSVIDRTLCFVYSPQEGGPIALRTEASPESFSFLILFGHVFICFRISNLVISAHSRAG